MIIATHFHHRAHLAEVLDEVVGERVVIVDDEQHGRVCGAWLENPRGDDHSVSGNFKLNPAPQELLRPMPLHCMRAVSL